MANLTKFVDYLLHNDKLELHPNANFLFDWPGVFKTNSELNPFDADDTFHAVIQNVDIASVDRHQVSLYLDGFEFPLNGPAKLGHTLSLQVLENVNYREHSSLYCSLLNLISGHAESEVAGIKVANRYLYKLATDFQTITQIGDEATERITGGRSNVKVGDYAVLYMLNDAYNNNDMFKTSRQIRFYNPVLSRLSDITFDASNSDLTKFTIDITYTYALGNVQTD